MPTILKAELVTRAPGPRPHHWSASNSTMWWHWSESCHCSGPGKPWGCPPSDTSPNAGAPEGWHGHAFVIITRLSAQHPHTDMLQAWSHAILALGNCASCSFSCSFSFPSHRLCSLASKSSSLRFLHCLGLSMLLFCIPSHLPPPWWNPAMLEPFSHGKVDTMGPDLQWARWADGHVTQESSSAPVAPPVVYTHVFSCSISQGGQVRECMQRLDPLSASFATPSSCPHSSMTATPSIGACVLLLHGSIPHHSQQWRSRLADPPSMTSGHEQPPTTTT